MWGFFRRIGSAIKKAAHHIGSAIKKAACYITVPVAAVAVGVAAVFTGVAAVACAAVAAGFAVVNQFKNETTKETLLVAGWKKIDHVEETKQGARVVGGILSLGSTEVFGTHYRIIKSDVCDAAGNFLGSTVSEAVKKAREQGEEYLKNGDYESARTCLAAADANCPSDLKDVKRAIQESMKIADYEIQYKKGLDLFRNGNFKDAVVSLQIAIDKCSDEDRKSVFLKTCNNAKAELCFQKAQEILQSDMPDETKYLNAKDSLDEALQLSSHDYSGRENFEESMNSATANIERIKNIEKAANLFDEGRSLWDNAGNTEKDGNAAEAASTYEDAKKKFEEAFRIDNNAEYTRWLNICKAKIKGNNLYNQMQAAAREANRHFTQGQNENALTKFTDAYNLCEKAKEVFNELDNSLGNTTSANWLANVEAKEKTLANVIQTVSLHIPSEILHGVTSPPVEMQSNSVPIYSMGN